MISAGSMDMMVLEAGVAWDGHARWMPHESLPLAVSTRRTLVRINVPGWCP